MSLTEAQTGRSSVKKLLRRQLTCSQCLLPRKSEIKSGSRGSEVCRHNDSNYTFNMTEIPLQSCGEKIGEEAESVTPTARRRPLDQNQLRQKLAALRQVFSASVNCFRSTVKPGEGGSCDEGEYHPTTIFNRYTRDSVDLNTVCGGSVAEIHQCSNGEHWSPVEERKTIESRTFKLLSSLVVRSKGNYPGSEDSLQSKGFWRQKPKRIGVNKKYITGEIIVLVNEHADESLTPSTYPEDEVKCYPEMLTVSMDVRNMTLEVKDKNAHAEASKTPLHVGSNMDVKAGQEGNLGGEIQMIPRSLGDSCDLQNNRRSQDYSQDLGNLHKEHTHNVVSERGVSEHPAVRDGIRLCTAFNSDSFSIHHNAGAENSTGPVANNIQTGTVTGDVSAVESLRLDASDGDFHVQMVQQCQERELLLLQTASSVVQCAITSALKQFKDELLDIAVHLDLCS